MNKEILIEKIEEGKTQREISQELGKSQTTVRYHLKKHGLCTDRSPKPHCCKICGETDIDKMMRKGPGRISRTRCKTCFSNITTEKGKKNKLLYIDYKGGKCQRCESTFDNYPEVFEFHHIDPSEKDVKFNGIRYWSWDRAKTELDKCVMLCANCHRIVHSEQTWDWPRG